MVAIALIVNRFAKVFFDLGFDAEIFKVKGMDAAVHPILTSQYPTPAKRPKYSLLETGKIQMGFVICMPTWRDSLDECLKSQNKKIK